MTKIEYYLIIELIKVEVAQYSKEFFLNMDNLDEEFLATISKEDLFYVYSKYMADLLNKKNK